VKQHALDDPASYAAVDPTDFLATVEGLAAQLVEAVRLAEAAEDLPSADGLSSIAVLGMGGSGISGELCRTVVTPVSPVPVATIRDYELPEWVGPDTLTFAVSYSGNTEETLAAFEQAAERKARVVAVTTGGRLAEVAAAHGYPVIRIPGGLMPRAALGFVGIPPLVACSRLGLAPGLDQDLAEALEVTARRVDECRRDVAEKTNPAKRLAVRLAGVLPLVCGAEGIGAAAAYRLKCQLNENAKTPALWAAFPEMNHNEVVGLYRTARPAGPVGVVVLRHPGEHPRVARRIELTASLLAGSVDFVEEVWARGSSPLARLLDLIAAGDLTSTYLSIATGVDPAPIAAIDQLKAALGR
jgi:glucose/mannose-6-phosphate isomerase